MAIFALTCGFFSVYHFHIILPSVSCTCLNTTIGFFFFNLENALLLSPASELFFFFFPHIYFCSYLTYAGFTFFLIFFFTFFFPLNSPIENKRELNYWLFRNDSFFSPPKYICFTAMILFCLFNFVTCFWHRIRERWQRWLFVSFSVSWCWPIHWNLFVYL